MRKTFLLILLLTALPALGDITRGGWQTARPILLPALSGPGPIYLPLDEAALTARTLGEYRIVRAANLETPYRMVEERGQIVSYPLDTRVVSLSACGPRPVSSSLWSCLATTFAAGFAWMEDRMAHGGG